MGQHASGRYCKYCNTHVMAVANTPNHILHLLLTVCSGGLWIPIWVIVILASAGNYRCSQCGNRL